MKTKLLSLFCLMTLLSFGQHQINSFYGTNNSSFDLLTSASPLDHSPTGADQIWTFSPLLSVGSTIYTYVAPTLTETTTYPGTTSVIVTNSTSGTTTTTGQMFTKQATNTVSITGLTATDLDINFSTNNATLGAFPMTYGFSNTDSSVSGTYTYTTYSGTFTGTLVTTVDAYGFLNLPDFFYSAEVTRLKTVLNLSLNYSIFSNVGTVTQTSYSYYDPTNLLNNPAFRSVTTAAVVPLMSINQTDTTLERFVSVLSNPNYDLQSVWVKNPIQNTIEINTTNSIDHATISVTDMLGKTIYQSNDNTISGTLTIPVALTRGVYLLSIGNDSGSITKKIIKS